ncbi:MAG TPA: flagellar biosynthetic protein FliQ [Spirochaetota bacterium]|nr:flagellar biosynthetic protein FliQ [Spirochaetota bacterium]
MTPEVVIDLVRMAMLTILKIAAPVLIVSVSIGLLIAVLQTTTSIQEQTLTFVPKILAVMGSIVFFSNYIINIITDFAMEMIRLIPYILE